MLANNHVRLTMFSGKFIVRFRLQVSFLSDFHHVIIVIHGEHFKEFSDGGAVKKHSLN